MFQSKSLIATALLGMCCARAIDAAEIAAPLDGLKRSGWQLIELLVKTFDHYRTVRLPYFEGLRYPHLERIDGTADRLTDILKPRT